MLLSDLYCARHMVEVDGESLYLIKMEYYGLIFLDVYKESSLPEAVLGLGIEVTSISELVMLPEGKISFKPIENIDDFISRLSSNQNHNNKEPVTEE